MEPDIEPDMEMPGADIEPDMEPDIEPIIGKNHKRWPNLLSIGQKNYTIRS